MKVRDAVNAGDLDAARRMVADADTKRAESSDGKPVKSFSDELGPLADAIKGNDLAAAKAALAELGFADTVNEAYEALKHAFPENPTPR
jgi:hypothetical protein